MASGKSGDLATLAKVKKQAAARHDAPGGGQDGADAKPPADLAAKCAAASEHIGGGGNITFASARECLMQNGLLPEKVSDILAREPTPVDWIIKDILAARGESERGFKGDIIAGSKK